jgi:hypothetical protein
MTCDEAEVDATMRLAGFKLSAADLVVRSLGESHCCGNLILVTVKSMRVEPSVFADVQPPYLGGYTVRWETEDHEQNP